MRIDRTLQHLNLLSQVIDQASVLSDVARKATTYRFPTPAAVTCYAHISGASVQLERTDVPWVEIGAHLRAPFAWRVAAEQDAAGVYFVALPRSVAKSVAGATIRLTIPRHLHVILRLEDCDFTLRRVSQTLEYGPDAPSPGPSLPPKSSR